MSTITIDRAVVLQVLDALEAMNPYPASKEDQRAAALTALRTVLAQEQAEPAAGDALLVGFLAAAKEAGVTHLSSEVIEAIRAALAQEQAEPDHETRAELAEQQVVQLAEERDHYRDLWQKAQQAEPAQQPADAHTTTLRALLEHCLSWQPDACVLGNVTAQDADAALRAALAQERAEAMTERDHFDLARWHSRLGELADAYYAAGGTNPARWRARAELMQHALDAATGWRVRSALAAQQRQQAAQAEPKSLPCPTPKTCREHCCGGWCIPQAIKAAEAGK